MPIQVMVLTACFDSALAHAALAAYLFAVLDERSWRQLKKAARPAPIPAGCRHAQRTAVLRHPRRGSFHPLPGRHPHCRAGLYAVDPVGLGAGILAGPLRRVHGGHIPDCPYHPNSVFVQQHIRG